MSTFTRYQAATAAAGIAVAVLGYGLGHTTDATVSPDHADSTILQAQDDRTLTETEVIKRPGGRPIVERPPVIEKRPRVPIGEVPPIKRPPIGEMPRRGNEGVGNGVDGDTPGHDNNGGNDDSGFTPGNPGATN